MKGLTPPAPRPRRQRHAGRTTTKVTKTGKFDTVAGYRVETGMLASDHRQGTVCVAEEGFSWLSTPMSALNGVPTEQLWMAVARRQALPAALRRLWTDGVKETARVG